MLDDSCLVYVAGPYSKGDPIENTYNICKIADRLLQITGVTPVVPHINMTWHLITPKPYKFWLDWCKQIMCRCDVVLRIAGESPGADEEVELAFEKGIPVVYAADNTPHSCYFALKRYMETIKCQPAS